MLDEEKSPHAWRLKRIVQRPPRIEWFNLNSDPFEFNNLFQS